jgi:hypothetical protein
MSELLTMEEIETRYAPDWVLIGEPQTDEKLNVLGGKVLFHSPDRDEVYRKAQELRPGRFAVEYLGTWPEDMALVLRAATHSMPRVVRSSFVPRSLGQSGVLP